MVSDVMFSSKTDDWATPQNFFDELNKEFNFTLDPCADDENHKCDEYYTKEQDGLSKDWGGDIQCSAIHLMGEKFIDGLKNVITKDTKKKQ